MWNLSIKKLARQSHSIKKYWLSLSIPIFFLCAQQKPILFTTIEFVYMMVPYIIVFRTVYLSETHNITYNTENIPTHTQPLHYLPPNRIVSHSFNSTVLYYIYSEATLFPPPKLTHPPSNHHPSFHIHRKYIILNPFDLPPTKCHPRQKG